MKEFLIKPQDIKVPEKEPFQYDLLKREEIAETLTSLVSSIKDSCVLALDAPWGAGKTTFLKMWSQYLRNKKFPVVAINVWETDFAEDPFVGLCTELTAELRKLTDNDSGLSKKIEDMENTAQIVFQIIWLAVSYKTGGAVNISQLLSTRNPTKPVTQRFDEYKRAKDSVKNFKEKLGAVSRALNNRPLFVMIDELDRCRPSYAVEFLEIAKHLFAVDNVAFVLAVNREQLAYTVKALYGNDFDAEGYLHRFFDIDFRLPEPNRGQFITELLKSTNIKEAMTKKALKVFFDASPLSLRDISQAIHRLGLVINSLSSDDEREMMTILAGILLIIRSLDITNYRQFVHGNITDAKVSELIFGITSIERLRWESSGILFQVGLRDAYKVFSGIESDTNTELENEIKDHVKSISTENKRKEINNNLEHMSKRIQAAAAIDIDFKRAYYLIELFSTDISENKGVFKYF